MRVFWLEATPFNPATETDEVVRACSVELEGCTRLNGVEWLPVIGELPTFSTAVFDGAWKGRAATSFGEIGLASGAGDIDHWATLNWSSRPITIYAAEIDTSTPGDPVYPAWEDLELLLDGQCAGFKPDLSQGTLSFTVKQPKGKVASETYLGTGGLEGAVEITGNAKPWASGRHTNQPATQLDSAKWLFQLHAYGPIESITTFREGGRPLDQTVVHHASFAALDAATPAATEIHVCLSEGCFRLGFEPIGEISCDFEGDAQGAYVETPGAVIKRLLTASGWLVADIDTGTLDDLDAYVPHPVGIADASGQDITEHLDFIMLACGGYWDVDALGVFYVGLTRRQDATLAAAPEGPHLYGITPDDTLDGYDLLDIEPIATRPPFHLNRMAYAHNPMPLSVQELVDLTDIPGAGSGGATAYFKRVWPQPSAPTTPLTEGWSTLPSLYSDYPGYGPQFVTYADPDGGHTTPALSDSEWRGWVIRGNEHMRVGTSRAKRDDDTAVTAPDAVAYSINTITGGWRLGFQVTDPTAEVFVGVLFDDGMGEELTFTPTPNDCIYGFYLNGAGNSTYVDTSTDAGLYLWASGGEISGGGTEAVNLQPINAAQWHWLEFDGVVGTFRLDGRVINQGASLLVTTDRVTPIATTAQARLVMLASTPAAECYNMVWEPQPIERRGAITTAFEGYIAYDGGVLTSPAPYAQGVDFFPGATGNWYITGESEFGFTVDQTDRQVRVAYAVYPKSGTPSVPPGGDGAITFADDGTFAVNNTISPTAVTGTYTAADRWLVAYKAGATRIIKNGAPIYSFFHATSLGMTEYRVQFFDYDASVSNLAPSAAGGGGGAGVSASASAGSFPAAHTNADTANAVATANLTVGGPSAYLRATTTLVYNHAAGTVNVQPRVIMEYRTAGAGTWTAIGTSATATSTAVAGTTTDYSFAATRTVQAPATPTALEIRARVENAIAGTPWTIDLTGSTLKADWIE